MVARWAAQDWRDGAVRGKAMRATPRGTEAAASVKALGMMEAVLRDAAQAKVGDM